MNFSAIIPAVDAVAANAELASLGYGPANFSVATQVAGSVNGSEYAGLHCWSHPAFQADVAALPYAVEITEGTGQPNYVEACEAQGLEPWNGDIEALPMIGDERTYGGKTWASLIDYNSWIPPVAWREVVATGYPAWVQPTGAHDAYKIGDKVSFEGANYESVINGNVWSPTAYPAGWKVIV